MTERYQPMQPVELDSNGVVRFRGNAVVQYLLDNGGLSLNDLGREEFPTEDRDQFHQLINYSVSGAPISFELADAAQDAYEKGKPEHQARIECLERKLTEVRNALRDPIANLFNIHPDDLS